MVSLREYDGVTTVRGQVLAHHVYAHSSLSGDSYLLPHALGPIRLGRVGLLLCRHRETAPENALPPECAVTRHCACCYM